MRIQLPDTPAAFADAGWDDVAPTWPTLGDVDSPEALERYQNAKREHKARMRAQSA